MKIDVFIPLEKSWLMRMGILDITHGRHQIIDLLRNQPRGSLNTDLEALLRAGESWRNGAEINVGESGTLYRFLLFGSWVLNLDVSFVTEGTLRSRKLTVDPSIVDLTLEELRSLDARTSQWASAAVLMRDEVKPQGVLPYHLAMSFEAKKHWADRINAGLDWLPRKDATIMRQAHAYEKFMRTGAMDFTPLQAEDYCFARAFNLMDASKGEKYWPSLRQHESDRIVEMEKALDDHIVDSHDHRVVQAVAMAKGSKVQFSNPNCVNKSWPQFWDFLGSVHISS